MKRYILILTLIFINIIFIIQKVMPIRDNKINIRLNKNELGIVFIDKNLLFSLNNRNILYVINYNENLLNNIDDFKINIDYIIMNQDYDINIGIKKILDDKLTLNNIEFSKNGIIYKNKKLCLINNDECNYIYDISNSLIIINDIKYKISKYTLLKMSDTYEIKNIDKC